MENGKKIKERVLSFRLKISGWKLELNAAQCKWGKRRCWEMISLAQLSITAGKQAETGGKVQRTL